MHFVRKALLVLVGAVFPLLLFATAFDFAILRVAGSPASVKQTLSDSGIYNSVVNNALDQAKQSTQADGSQIDLTDPAIKKAANESFTPQVIQNSSEKVIDGIYNWLNGKTTQPDFNVDLSSTKQTFAEKVGEAAKQRAATLPVCTSIPATTDPLSATCLPPGVTPAQVGEQAKDDVLNAQGFLDHPDITSSSIKAANGQSVFTKSKAQKAPQQFQRIKKTPIVLPILTVLAILAIIFLSATKRVGLRHIGRSLVVVGAFMLLFAWGASRVVVHNIIPKIHMDNKLLENNVHKLATDVAQSVDKNYWIFGGIYLALGAIAFLAAYFLGRGSKPAKLQSVPAAKQNAPPAPKPQTKQQTPKPPRKIQG